MITYDERDRIGGISPQTSQKLSIGGTIRDTFRAVGRAWGTLYGMAAVLAILGLPTAFMFSKIITKSTVPRLDPQASVDKTQVTTLVALFAVQMLITLYAYGVMNYGAKSVLENGRFDFGAALKVALARYLPMLVSALALYVVLVLATLLLIVPGIIASAVYGLAPTLCVIERNGPFASFSRSATLTRGNRWRCFCVSLIVLLVPGLLQAAVNAALGILVGPQFNLFISSFTSIFILPILYVFPTALTHQLKLLREGGAPSGVADVF